MAHRFALQRGDKIGILSTARWLPEEDIEFADEIFRSWGYVPVYGRSIGAREDQFAGDDVLRAGDLQNFLDDIEIKAIICARGGYGTIRIMDRIDFTKFTNNPKLICGFSDITVLHTHISDKLGLPSLHSTMPVSFSKNSEESLQSLKDALSGLTTNYNLNPHPLNVNGSADGEIIGGNLSILYSLLGTKYGFSTAGKILFIEDVDEYLYHIDRMMMSMKLAGKLNGLKGVIIGGMNNMKDNLVPFGKNAEQILAGYLAGLQIPVCFGFPAGHLDDNRAFLFRHSTNFIVDTAGSRITFK